MKPMKTILSAGAFCLAALPALADGIKIEDAYARASSGMAKAGAAFMVIKTTGTEDDRLVAASSDVAKRVELHTHKIDANGVAKMMEIEEGFAIPAGGEHALARGGDHVMFMGLTAPFEQDRILIVTLTFENAGALQVEIPVDLERAPMIGGQVGQGHNGHGGHGMKKAN